MSIISTLVVLYIDDISNYIEIFGGSGGHLTGVATLILLYADDIVLLSKRLQRHLNKVVKVILYQLNKI